MDASLAFQDKATRSERETFEAIDELQAWLEALDMRGNCARKTLDDLLRLRHQRAALRRLSEPSTRNFALFRHARLLWRQYTLVAPKRTPKSEDLLDAQIIHTKAHLHQLRSHRQELTSQLARLKASVSAVGRIPPELWSVIFQYAMPEDQVYIRPSVRNGPLLFCQVCSYWRGIAISTSHLWNSLSITRKEGSASLAKLWLQRSGSLPLSIEISVSPHMEPAQYYRTLATLLSFSERWYRLRLNLTEHLVRSVLSTPMPTLEILEFGSNHAISSLHLAPQFAPKLRSVSLLTVPLDPTPLNLPWNQIVHFSSRCWADMQSHLDVLKRCPDLEKCRIHLLHAQCPSMDSTAPLVLQNLKSMEIVAFTGSAMGPFLDRLTLPSLTELSLVVPDESPACGVSEWPRSVTSALAERSSCKTVQVYLQGIASQKASHHDTTEVLLEVVEIDT
ncbi:hypothetical protein CC1G_06904 [Coprinopsis cinerea okayama7|uniref:Uncharacterized protein n=1 Tax=Coprinopsis cinerea (strain Okayama-7 / 130 / ATCC MYA-4618 / FGSC 9003) TaxID=240176 RepID=A8N732_COPC7|nr:hypothetical protein CC1G_06904 [Coprinopsis cinerea okayama7\|eukprot:XP_001830638.1 hypothetical protein CC1G_06904 [Coprinopsis cinerea okayama7\